MGSDDVRMEENSFKDFRGQQDMGKETMMLPATQPARKLYRQNPIDCVPEYQSLDCSSLGRW